MSISNIALTSSMRANLESLQSTSKLMAQTQSRLASGKKVNSALDNPTNFFAAQNAANRANDLSDRKDGMSEAIQTINAANAGITAITGLIQAAKGLAQSALSTSESDTTTRNTLSAQYDTIRGQIAQLASDSGYRGLNLLHQDAAAANQTLTVNFNEDATSSLDVIGFDATDDGADLDLNGTNGASVSVSGGKADWTTNAKVKQDTTQMDKAISTLRSQTQTLAANVNVITNRQNFTDSMVNTLQVGSDNLTLADMNEEGANMLALQTRQSLGTTSLSMSSQAAQSILKLF